MVSFAYYTWHVSRWENLIKISSSKITLFAHFLIPASFSSFETCVERVTCQFWMFNFASFCVSTFVFYSQNTLLANLFDTSLVSIWNMDRTSLNLDLPIFMLYINHFRVCSLFLHHHCFSENTLFSKYEKKVSSRVHAKFTLLKYLC